MSYNNNFGSGYGNGNDRKRPRDDERNYDGRGDRGGGYNNQSQQGGYNGGGSGRGRGDYGSYNHQQQQGGYRQAGGFESGRGSQPPYQQQGGRGGFDGGRGGFDGGRGGFDGGRGGRGGFEGRGRGNDGGRGGGGRGEKKPHMGLDMSLINMVKSSPQCSDQAALAVICPPAAERMRDPDGAGSMPTVAAWRYDRTAGVPLNSDAHVVRCNHFKVHTGGLPTVIYQYDISVFKHSFDGSVGTEDLVKGKDSDKGVNRTLLDKLRARHPEWNHNRRGKAVGFAYDGNAALFTSDLLPCIKSHDVNRNDSYQEEVRWAEDSNRTYTVRIMFVANVKMPQQPANDGDMTGSEWADIAYKQALHALDVVLTSFARNGEGQPSPSWILSGAKMFRTSSTLFPLIPGLVAMVGYHASLKAVKAGLVLVADVSVSAFVQGGDLIEVMAAIGRYSNRNAMVTDSRNMQSQNSASGLKETTLRMVTDVLKGCRLKTKHLGTTVKFKEFGPPAYHESSRFRIGDSAQMMSVEQYYLSKVHDKEPGYLRALGPNGLSFGFFPTVNVGKRTKPLLIPIELLTVLPGQTRQRIMNGEISSKMIKIAAKLPDERMTFIKSAGPDDLMKSATGSVEAISVGLDNISLDPMRLLGTVLVPAKLQYANQRVIEPLLTGTWNLANGLAFFRPAPNPIDGTYLYQVLVVYSRDPPRDNSLGPVANFKKSMESESRIVGIPMRCAGADVVVSGASRTALTEQLAQCKENGVRIVVVVQMQDCYPMVKLCADSLSLPSQCLQWKNVEKAPRGYQTNVLMKMNIKMGGVNHTLTTRGTVPPNAPKVFQQPPQSISWLFDDLCMVVGVDVNHPEKSNPGAASIAAVVASMDGMMGQYCAHISTCESGAEPVATLETAVCALLKTFASRNNGQFPKRMLVYRDGVADNQFQDVLENELAAYQNAFMLCGLLPEAIQTAIVVCQKRHHTRLVYDKAGEYQNPCVGLCVDGNSGVSPSQQPLESISSPTLNEFYLNSHLAVLGTSKPCKYSLIYDDIGFKMAELELLTYWTTHLYCRCTRSVSYATPAYYAHWASRRGRALLTAGASPDDLRSLSEKWLQGNRSDQTMYFI